MSKWDKLLLKIKFLSNDLRFEIVYIKKVKRVVESEELNNEDIR